MKSRSGGAWHLCIEPLQVRSPSQQRQSLTDWYWLTENAGEVGELNFTDTCQCGMSEVKSTGTNVGGYYCTHWCQCWRLLLHPLIPMLGVVHASSNANSWGYYCIYWQKNWGLLLHPLITMLGVIIAFNNTNAGGLYSIYWHQCWDFLLRPMTPMLGFFIVSNVTNAGVTVGCGSGALCLSLIHFLPTDVCIVSFSVLPLMVSTVTFIFFTS